MLGFTNDILPHQLSIAATARFCSGDITLRMRKVLAIPPSLWLVCFSAEISVTIEYPCCAVAMKDFSRGKLSCTVYCSSPNLVPRSHSVFWSWEIWVRDYSSPSGTSLVRVSEASLFQVFRLWGRRRQMRAGF